MRFVFASLIVTLVAAQSWAQGCSGRGGLFAFQGATRERHVVVTRHAATAAPRASAGCLGSVASVALAPVTTMESRTITRMVPVTETIQVPRTTWVAAPVAAQAAPAPQKMPIAGGPVTVFAPQTAEPPLFGVRPLRATVQVGAGFLRKVLDLILPPYRR